MSFRYKAHLVSLCCCAVVACADSGRPIVETPNLFARTDRANAAPERNSDRDYLDASKRYSDESDSSLFRLASTGDTTFVVGVKIPGTRRGVWKGEVYVDETLRRSSQMALSDSSAGFRVVGGDSLLPVLYVKVSTREALAKLRRLPFVDYVEPNTVGKDFSARSGDPCGVPAPGLPISYDANGEIVNPPWVTENIVAAWQVNQGEGVTLGLADALIDFGQTEFYADSWTGGFTGGLSTGRLFEQQTAAPGVTGSTCSHGSRMATLMAAPRNGYGTNGVAWRANLRSGGAIEGPNIQWGPSITQIMLGVRYAADETDASRKHVVAMAFGQTSHSDLLSDEINRLYYQHDVLFIGAAGTNVPNYPFGGSSVVIFPASKGEVLAVSATELDGTKNPESSGNGKVELTAFSKNLVGGYNIYSWVSGANSSNTVTELNHSSAATAVISGVAALVRTRFPQMTNVQVRAQLLARTLTVCNERSDWKPVVDALAAVGSFCGYRFMTKPPQVNFASANSPPQTVTVSLSPLLIPQNTFSHVWFNGSTQTSTTITVYPPPGTPGVWRVAASVSVTGTDHVLGQSRTETLPIMARVGTSGCANCQ